MMTADDMGTYDLLTREEAAVYAGVSPATIDRRLRDGTLPKHVQRVPRRVLIPRAALDLLIKARVSTHAYTWKRLRE
jgi:excisionase family DNA binding protein